MSLWTIFVTGLTTGGLTCVAVQGGLLAGYLATRKGENGFHWRGAVAPTALFLAAKLFAYTIVGALLGLLGSVFQLSLTLRVALQVIVGLFMVVAALQLLSVHPFFHRFQIRTPSFLRRLIRSSAAGESISTPILLGLLTIFIPCGTTIAMEALAVASGSAFTGGTILAVFVIGTVPLFFAIGVLAHAGMTAFRGLFTKVAAATLIILGLLTVNSGLVMADSPFAAQNILAAVRKSDAQPDPNVGFQTLDVQKITLTVISSGYTPRNITLAAGVPVELTLIGKNAQGCARAFTIPKYRIQTIVPETGETTVRFTPTKAGRVGFSCSMGMYTGVFEVI